MRRRDSLFIGFAGVVLSTALVACSSSRAPGTGHGTDGGATATDMQMVTSKVTQVVFANGASSDSAGTFSANANPAQAPKVVYPSDGVIMPPNLSEFELQWTPGGDTNLYELRFVSTYLDLTVYTPCAPIANGCGYLPDEDVWMLMSTQSRGDSLQVTIRGVGPSGVAAAATRTISFTEEDLNGGLYYWAAAAGQIVRYDFGKRGQSAELFYTPAEAGATCVGCHSVARNGERIAVGLNAPIPTAGLRILDIASKSTLYNGASNFSAFSPDGSRALVNSTGGLTMIDVMTGGTVGTDPAIADGNLPDWSADGKRVVFARNGSCPVPFLCASQPGVSSAALFIADLSGDTFGPPASLVTGGGNNFYPTFSPDGSLVAFNRSTANNNSFDATDARVWVVSSMGGAPVQLTGSAATASNVGDSWPKFAPYSHHFKGETIFWLTFASRRDYGLRLLNSLTPPTTDSQGNTNDPRKAQVWMVGVPASALKSGAMPAGGYPAFWLPFQSLASGNHIAQWVEKIVHQPCNAIDGTPCPTGQQCQGGECVGIPIL